MTSVVRWIPSSRSSLRANAADGVAPAHRPQDAVVAGLERDVEVRRHGRRLPERRGQLVVDVVHLDRGEPEPFDARERACLADEPREGVAGLAVAEAAEVDAGEDDLTVPLLDAPADLREHGRRGPAPGRATHLRDHAEGAGEGAAVLDPDERPPAVELVLGRDAPDGTDVCRDEPRCVVAGARGDDDVLGRAGERAFEARRAARHVDRPGRARGPCCRLPRLRDGLVRHAAGVDDLDLASRRDLGVAVAEQALTDRLCVGERDLASEKARREGRHAKPKSLDGRIGGSFGGPDEDVGGPAVELPPRDAVARRLRAAFRRRDTPT